MTVDRQISSEGHMVRLAVEQTSDGWNVREELDSITVQLKHYGDWHRVDRAVRVLEWQVLQYGVSALH